jgi:hypothetical protein
MNTQELRLKLVDIIVSNVKGLAAETVIEVAKKYEGYIDLNISDKVKAPDDSQKEGRTDSDVSSKKKPR